MSISNVNSLEFYNKNITLEKYIYANQSDRSVLVNYGGTSVLVTLTIGKGEHSDSKKYFGLSLMVDFLFRAYSLNEIPKGFFRREGKLTEREILASRIVDRTFRPLIDNSVSNDICLNCIMLAYDKESSPEVAAIIGSSYVFGISNIPFKEPVIGMPINVDSKGNVLLDSMSLNQTLSFNNNDQTLDDRKLNVFVSSTSKSIVMVEAESTKCDEKDILNAIMTSYKESQTLITWIQDNINDYYDSNTKSIYNEIDKKIVYLNDDNLNELIKNDYVDKFRSVYSEQYINKQYFVNKISNIKQEIFSEYQDKEYSLNSITLAIKHVEKIAMLDNISKHKKRIDGRDFDTVRNIDIKLNVLPGVHGSSLFTRGETQALVVTTLGDMSDAQIVDNHSSVKEKEKFMLHYNFHSFSVGEVGMGRAPGRREIGHGKLALKSLKDTIPSFNKAPYTIRLVSEILSSDGSSSMATVCGGTLSLMDAGIKINTPIAGIAMGLVVDNNDESIVLTDISGEEDSLGDMDFKVAGCRDYVTSMQMDVKCDYITQDVLQKSLEQAKKGRLLILDKMNDSISNPRYEYKDSVKKIEICNVVRANISKLIGSGGKTIKSICEATNSTIDIEDDKAYISSQSIESLKDAVNLVKGLAGSEHIVPYVGMRTRGMVAGVQSFGVFVIIGSANQGLVHVSEMLENDSGSKVNINEGDIIDVVVKSYDSKTGKVQLSMFLDKYQSGYSSSKEDNEFKSSHDFYKKNKSVNKDKMHHEKNKVRDSFNKKQHSQSCNKKKLIKNEDNDSDAGDNNVRFF